MDLPRTRRSGFSATIGFVMVVALLLVGGSLAVSGGGGVLNGGGRFFGPEVTPSPTPAPALAVVDPDASVAPFEDDVVVPKNTTANMKNYTCENGAIKDLSRGKWIMSDVKSAVREEDGIQYDQVYWRMDRQNSQKVKPAKTTAVTMKWSTPDALKERFGEAIGRVQGDKALLITFDGPVTISSDAQIEQYELEDDGIDQIRRVQLFEHQGKVRTVIGIKGDSCARLGSVQWGAKSTKDNSRVVLDIERFE